MSKEHAMRFPLVGSAMLLSLFLLFKFLSKDLVNAVLTAYFFILGIVALSYVQIFSEYLCRHVYLWANDCIHSLVQGNIASIYKTFSSKRMEWQSHCMAGSIYPLYEPHSLWCSFLFVQLCRSWNKLLLCFQWYPVALFDYIFNAAVIEIKIVVTESRYTNLLCGLNDFELLHHWCFQPCYKQNDIAPCGYGHFSVKLEKLYAGMEIHSLLTAFLMDIWKLHFPSRNRCIMCQSCHPLQSLFLKMV